MALLYEGKAKRIFSTDNEGQLRVEYKDEVTVVMVQKDKMEGKDD